MRANELEGFGIKKWSKGTGTFCQFAMLSIRHHFQGALDDHQAEVARLKMPDIKVIGERVRDICPDMWILVPGVGAQEGDLEAAVQAAMNADGGRFILNASRAVLYAAKDDGYAKSARKAAQKLRSRINLMREAALARR